MIKVKVEEEAPKTREFIKYIFTVFIERFPLSEKEVIEWFFNPFQVKRNKQFKDRFQLIGKTDAGRRLKIIFQLKQKNIVRIITGWDVWKKNFLRKKLTI